MQFRNPGSVRAAIAHSVLGLGLMTGALGAGLALDAAPAVAKDSKPTNSAEFVAAAAPLQKTLQAGQPLIQKYVAAQGEEQKALLGQLRAAFAAAPAQLAAAEAAIKTPMDRFLAGAWGKQVGMVLGDDKLLAHALQNVIDSGMGTPAEQAEAKLRLGAAAYSGGDYATAVKILGPLVQANVADEGAAQMLSESYVKLGQVDQGLASLKDAVATRKAAGGAVPEAWFKRGIRQAYLSKKPEAAVDFGTGLIAAAPTKQNWTLVLQVARELGHYAGEQQIDLLRLMVRTNSFAEKQDYFEFVEVGNKLGLAKENLTVIDQGIANGTLSATDQFVSENRAVNSTRVKNEAAQGFLAGYERDAHKPGASTATIAGAGSSFLSYGEAAKAKEFFTMLVARPDADPALAYTRLGITQVDTGDYAGAQASFAKVQGPRATVAKLWIAYAQQKAAGK